MAPFKNQGSLARKRRTPFDIISPPSTSDHRLSRSSTNRNRRPSDCANRYILHSADAKGSKPGGGSSSIPIPQTDTIACSSACLLERLHFCFRPFIIYRDALIPFADKPCAEKRIKKAIFLVMDKHKSVGNKPPQSLGCRAWGRDSSNGHEICRIHVASSELRHGNKYLELIPSKPCRLHLKRTALLLKYLFKGWSAPSTTRNSTIWFKTIWLNFSLCFPPIRALSAARSPLPFAAI